MAMFSGRVPAEQLGTAYTHRAVIFGFVPVYVGDPQGECRVAVRNGWPDWLLDVGAALFNLAAAAAAFINPEFEHPGFPIKVKGKLP